MLKIENHWFTPSDEVEHIACPKNTQLFDRGQPDTIVIHYTAGKNGISSAHYLAKDNVKASAHLVLDRSGKIIQLVPFNTISWHAGKSSYAERSGFNNFSIGIEIDNAGILEKTGDMYKSWFGKKYTADEVVKATHRNESTERYWHTYTEEQIDTVQLICEKLMDTYPTIKYILGHEEIAPGRKQDPGPAFPLNKLRTILLDSRQESGSDKFANAIGFVDVDGLNIREMPSVNSDTVAEPLPEGTKVRIQAKHNNWYKVTAEIEGWVAADYIAFNE